MSQKTYTLNFKPWSVTFMKGLPCLLEFLGFNHWPAKGHFPVCNVFFSRQDL